MDGVNNPLFDPAVIAAAAALGGRSAAPAAAAGHAFFRYTVGGLPPDEEQRHSAPDVDCGLNAVGMYGGLSFIIEAAVRRSAPDPSADLAGRVDAYLDAALAASSGTTATARRTSRPSRRPAPGRCLPSSRRTTSGSTRG